MLLVVVLRSCLSKLVAFVRGALYLLNRITPTSPKHGSSSDTRGAATTHGRIGPKRRGECVGRGATGHSDT